MAVALAYRHIQVNPPNAIFWIVIDIDEPVISDPISRQMKAIFDGMVPLPNFLAVNPESGRAHAYYALSRAVAKGDHTSIKAMRYVAAIEAALIFALGGDPQYANMIAKNPVHPDWRRVDLRSEPYTLHELEDGLDLFVPDKSSQREELKNAGAAGRNVTVFDRLRFHAYQHVMMYKSDADYMTWKRYLSARADDYNDSVPALPANEVRHIVTSVAKWTWTHYTGTLSNEAFSELQAFRGARGGRISARVQAEQADKEGTTVAAKMKAVRACKKADDTKPAQAIQLRAEGVSVAEIARRLKISRPTVYVYLKSVK
ncbi:hypothetical protein ASF66_21710 [Pseudomonas sp. Leaf129]|nr:hypothetical protein ASF66_21710 [Pseudomonas sp. Leaf129]